MGKCANKGVLRIMAGAYPANPNNLDLHTTDGGTVYQYKSDHGRWVLYKDSTAYVEKAGDTMTGELLVEGNIKTRNGGVVRAYSADNSKFFTMSHDGTDSNLDSSSGDILISDHIKREARMRFKFNSPPYFRNLIDADWQDVEMGTLTQHCAALPYEDPITYKDNLPEFVLKRKEMEEYEDLEGKIKEREIDAENIGVDTYKLMKHNFNQIEILIKEFEDLKKKVG